MATNSEKENGNEALEFVLAFEQAARQVFDALATFVPDFHPEIITDGRKAEVLSRHKFSIQNMRGNNCFWQLCVK
jgi:hypothetical protein